MKKIILVFGFILCLCTPQAMADTCYSRYCPTAPYAVSSKGNQTFSKVTGLTFLSEKVAQTVIKHELKKATKENFKVKIKAYSLKDLKDGKFKSMTISGKNLDIDDVYISSLNIQTLCDFNSVDVSKKEIKFRENMPMEFSMNISSTDLKKTINSTGYLKMLNKTNLSAFGITFFKLDSADVNIKNNKLYFTINVTTPLSAQKIPVTVSTDLKVEDGKIVVTKVALLNAFSVIDLSKMANILNMLNPLTFSTELFNNTKTKTSIQTIDIIGSQISVKGNILIPKTK